MLPLLSVRLVVTFPAAEHRPLAGTKLYCLVTEVHRCEQLAQGCYAAFAPSRIWTHDLLIASQMLKSSQVYLTTLQPKWPNNHVKYKIPYKTTIQYNIGPNTVVHKTVRVNIILSAGEKVERWFASRTRIYWYFTDILPVAPSSQSLLYCTAIVNVYTAVHFQSSDDSHSFVVDFATYELHKPSVDVASTTSAKFLADHEFSFDRYLFSVSISGLLFRQWCNCFSQIHFNFSVSWLHRSGWGRCRKVAPPAVGVRGIPRKFFENG